LILSVDDWSRRAVPLTMKTCGDKKSTATGFFWRSGDDVYLITNWHVLSGRDTKFFQPLDQKNSTIPDELCYPRYVYNSHPLNIKFYSVEINASTKLESNWLEHPEWGSSVDIGALKIATCSMPIDQDGITTEILEAGKCRSLLLDKMFGNLKYYGPRKEMGDDLFVIGFPLGTQQTRNLPIWKRASVASEMDFQLGGKSAFLIDTAGRPGMSGAPVVFIEQSAATQMGMIRRRPTTFMGIYSGRHIGETDFEAQLGIVWREELINEVVLGGKRALYQFTDLDQESSARKCVGAKQP